MKIYIANAALADDVEALNDDKDNIILEEHAAPVFIAVNQDPDGTWINKIKEELLNNIVDAYESDKDELHERHGDPTLWDWSRANGYIPGIGDDDDGYQLTLKDAKHEILAIISVVSAELPDVDH